VLLSSYKENGLYYETDGEIVIYIKHFILKDACLISIDVEDSEEYEIKYILCEGKYIAFDHSNNKYIFQIEISGLLGPTRTLYAHSILREDGITLRVEENDIGRCAGKYDKDTYPQTQIDASVHYTFAAREVLRHMGIGKYLHDNHLGYILLLGFETCNELHPDYPPHWHLIFRWPYFCGSQAPHIYIDKEGNNPLMKSAISNNISVITALLAKTKDINTQNKQGLSALTLAVENNTLEVIDFLLLKNADVQVVDRTGNTLYHYAIKRGDIKILEKLSLYPININQKNSNGLTPLQMAVMTAKNLDVVRFLLNKGADKNLTTDLGETVYELAQENEALKGMNIEFLK